MEGYEIAKKRSPAEQVLPGGKQSFTQGGKALPLPALALPGVPQQSISIALYPSSLLLGAPLSPEVILWASTPFPAWSLKEKPLLIWKHPCSNLHSAHAIADFPCCIPFPSPAPGRMWQPPSPFCSKMWLHPLLRDTPAPGCILLPGSISASWFPALLSSAACPPPPPAPGNAVQYREQQCWILLPDQHLSHAGLHPSVSNTHPSTFCILHKHLCLDLLKGQAREEAIVYKEHETFASWSYPLVLHRFWEVRLCDTAPGWGYTGSKLGCRGSECAAKGKQVSDRCRAPTAFSWSPQFLRWVPWSIPQATPHLQHPPRNWKPTNHPTWHCFPCLPKSAEPWDRALPARQSRAPGPAHGEWTQPVQEEEQVRINLERREVEEDSQPGGNSGAQWQDRGQWAQTEA